MVEEDGYADFDEMTRRAQRQGTDCPFVEEILTLIP